MILNISRNISIQRVIAAHSPFWTRIFQSLKRIVAVGVGLSVMALALCASAQSNIDQPTIENDLGDDTLEITLSNNWPGFRGVGALGHAVQANPPIDWNVEERKNILWKTKVPKPGMNSPVICDNRLFLTGADELSRVIYCFDTDTGDLLWHHEVNDILEASLMERMHNVMEFAGLAAPTVTTNGQYVAAIFATGELVCVNTTGKRIWAKHLGIPENHYGHTSSLICYENLLFVQFDQLENSKLLAFDLATGYPVWEVERDVISWSSPILVDNKGRMELILTNSLFADSYNPKNGKHLWHVECLYGEVAPSAAYADGVLYVANENAVAAAIDIGNHDTEPKILWTWDEIMPDASSLLANDDYLILPSGFGVVACLDAKTGKMFWEHEFDEGFYSSPILVNNRVYIIDLNGTMQVFKMDDTFEQLGTSTIAEDAYATPAFSGDKIFIRGDTHLFCIAASMK